MQRLKEPSTLRNIDGIVSRYQSGDIICISFYYWIRTYSDILMSQASGLIDIGIGVNYRPSY